MKSPGNHILPHYDAALNAIRLRVNAICGSLLKYMDILERVISGPDSDGANSIIADSDPLQEETRQVLSLCSSVLTQFHPLGRDLRLVITFSRCGDKLQECMEEVTGIAKHAKASIRHQESLSPDPSRRTYPDPGTYPGSSGRHDGQPPHACQRQENHGKRPVSGMVHQPP